MAPAVAYIVKRPRENLGFVVLPSVRELCSAGQPKDVPTTLRTLDELSLEPLDFAGCLFGLAAEFLNSLPGSIIAMHGSGVRGRNG